MWLLHDLLTLLIARTIVRLLNRAIVIGLFASASVAAASAGAEDRLEVYGGTWLGHVVNVETEALGDWSALRKLDLASAAYAGIPRAPLRRDPQGQLFVEVTA